MAEENRTQLMNTGLEDFLSPVDGGFRSPSRDTTNPLTACCSQMLASGTSSSLSQEDEGEASKGPSRAASSRKRRATVAGVVATKSVASRISTHLSKDRSKVCATLGRCCG